MTPRENLLSLYRRQGYETAPLGMHFCPALKKEFERRYPEAGGDYLAFFGAPYRIIYDPGFAWNFDEVWRIPGRGGDGSQKSEVRSQKSEVRSQKSEVRGQKSESGGQCETNIQHPTSNIEQRTEAAVDWRQYYPDGFTHGVKFDGWGVAHEESPGAHHMTRMHHPLARAASVAELESYPWPDFERLDFSYLKPEVKAIQAKGLAVFVWAECTIWETAWYLRSMENLFVDMGCDEAMATCLFDTITDRACYRAKKFAEAGVDIVGLGDDIGMQSAAMMSVEMYRTWLKPRLARVIAAAKAVKPDILISYHSCGYVLPFIDDLIEAGVDILNPVQPECMEFAKLHAKYGNRLSFSGTLGTQQIMPYGTPQQVRDEVRRNLTLAGERGGLFCCPTHMLEPEVPWANVEAYVEAIKSFRV